MMRLISLILSLFTICTFGQKGSDLVTFQKAIEHPVWKFKTHFTYFDAYNGYYCYDSILVIKGCIYSIGEGCSQDKFYGLDNNSGKVIWSYIDLAEDYYFHSGNIICKRSDKVFCLDIFSGKTIWTYQLLDSIPSYCDFSIIDSTVYLFRQKMLYNSGIENDSTYNSELIILNENTGNVIKHITDIPDNNVYYILNLNKSEILLCGSKTILAFDLSNNKELWKKEFRNPESFYSNESHDSLNIYSFICSKGDTIFFFKKKSSYDFKNGIKTLFALNLKNGNLIKEVFINNISENELKHNNNIFLNSKNELFFIKNEENYSADSSDNANYILVCFDLYKLQEKWQLNISDVIEKFKICYFSHLYFDSKLLYLTYDNCIVCISPESGQVQWTKLLVDDLAFKHFFTNNFIICDELDKITVIDKNNNLSTNTIKTKISHKFIDDSKVALFLIDEYGKLIKIKID